jgi:hypothetical protein
MSTKRTTHLRHNVRLPGQAAVDVLKVSDRNVLGSVEAEAGSTKGEDVVQVIDERLAHVVGLGLEVRDAGELAELDLRLVAPIIYHGGLVSASMADTWVGKTQTDSIVRSAALIVVVEVEARVDAVVAILRIG